jgi:hypothetical protein
MSALQFDVAYRLGEYRQFVMEHFTSALATLVAEWKSRASRPE